LAFLFLNAAHFAIVSLSRTRLTAVGEGQNPHSLPEMRCTSVGSRYNSPDRIVPQVGKVAENNSHSPPKQRWDVLHEDVSRSYLANDPGKLSPESASLTSDACAASGDGYVLAGEAPGDDVNESAPLTPGEGPHVIPYREWFKDSISLSCEQGFSAVGINLDSADTSESEEEIGKDSSADSSE
jgi:hypothetical protein